MRGVHESRENGRTCLFGLALILGVIAIGWGALAMYSQKAMVVASLF